MGVSKFDPLELFRIDQAMRHGVALVSQWLPKYKFKDWNETETCGKIVTSEMKVECAENIATELCDVTNWHSHGRGIAMKELCSEKLKLKIIDFSKRKELNEDIVNYHGLLVDYYSKMSYRGYIHSACGTNRIR